jgi:hypothetical protein
MSTRTANRPTPMQDQAPVPADPASRRPRLDLSVAQTIGGSLAAATAAAIGSRLGVVGTLTGAALVSVVASVAGALYTNSLRRTGHRVSSALRGVRGERRTAGTPIRGWRVLAGALTVFAVAAAAITAVELVSGTSLNGRHGSTTAAAAVQGDGTDRTPRHSAPADAKARETATPSPADTPTPTASVSPTSVPSQAAAATPSSAAPTAGETPEPTPTGAATATVTPSGGPSGAATTTPGGAASVTPGAVPAGPQDQ